MPALDLTDILLPDLTSDAYPVVAHAATCTDAAPTDTRSCHPAALSRPRPYAIPTAPLGRLRAPRGHRPALPPLPPSLGTHCPTIKSDIQLQVGDAAAIEDQTGAVELRNGDACRPTLRPVITLPCTRVEPEVQFSTGLPASANWEAPTTNRSNLQCIQGLLLKIKVPGCTLFSSTGNQVQMVDTLAQAGVARTVQNTTAGNCGITLTDIIKVPCVVPSVVAGAVTVNGAANGSALTIAQTGPACNRTITIGLNINASGGGSSNPGFSPDFVVDGTPPGPADCCVAGYGTGRTVPVIDVHGVLGGGVGQPIDTGDYVITNAGKRVLVAGDKVQLVVDENLSAPRNVYIVDPP